MSVPGLSVYSGAAAADLGYGGDALNRQMLDETEEERKKRLKLLAQQNSGQTSTQSGSIFGGLAVPALFGNYK